MTNSVITQIKKSQALVAKLKKTIADMEADGVDPTEVKRIEDNKKQIAALEGKLVALEKQFEADKAEWNGLSSDINSFQDKMKTLGDWGAIDVKALQSEFDGAQDLAKAENYRDAITRFGEVQTGLAKPYAEYEKQFAAMGKYDSAVQDINVRLDTVKASVFQTTVVAQGIATLEGNLPTAEALAAKKDYVAALDAIAPASGELTLIEKAVEKAAAEDAAVRKELEPLQAKAEECGKIDYPELNDRIATATTNVGQITGLIDALDFNGARAEIGTLSQELDAIAKEAEKLEAAKKAEEEKKRKQKEEWDRQSGRYKALNKQVGELEGFGSPGAPQLRQIVNDIEGYVTTEDHEGATVRLAQGESEVKAPYDVYLKQREAQKTFEAERPGIDQRAQAARQNPNCDSVLSKSIGELDGDLTFMDTKADAKDYIEANTKIAPAIAELDKIERDLRDLEMAAKVAEELGFDQSSPEVQNEIKRRLYLEEQPVAQGRIDKVAEADVLAKDATAQFDQLTGEMIKAETAFSAGSFPEAVDAVRMVIDEMPLVEDHVRKQTEKKNLYTAANKVVTAHLELLQNSAYTKIRDEIGTLDAGLAEGEALAEEHDYDGAREKVALLRTGIEILRANEAAIIKDHAEADAGLTMIQTRMEKALAIDSPELAPGQAGLKTKSAEVDEFYAGEDYKGALKAVQELTTLLEEFEVEAHKQQQHELYLSALETLELEGRLAAMHELAYPEAETEAGAVDTADADRLALAKSEDYEAARRKAFEEGTALDTFDARKDQIELARDQLEHNAGVLKINIDEALAAPKSPKESSDELVAAQADLKVLVDKMGKAVAEKRFIEAVQLSDKAKIKADEVIKIKFELTPINEAKTDEYITNLAQTAAGRFGAGAAGAVTNFRIDILDMVNTERAAQTFSKWTGYVMDVVTCVGNFYPNASAIVESVTTGIKTVVAIGADAYDSSEDDADRKAGNDISAALETQAGEVESSLNVGFAGGLKSKFRATYDEIGRFIAREEFPQARSALKAAGVMMDANVTAIQAVFLGQLREKLAETRPK